MSQHKKHSVFRAEGEEEGFPMDPPLKAADNFQAEEIVVEKKDGWKEITDEQQTGTLYFVTHDLGEPSVRAYWRKTRAMSHMKWVLHGKWSDALTNQYLIPQPIYYKEIK